jgi:hypothetical protein
MICEAWFRVGSGEARELYRTLSRSIANWTSRIRLFCKNAPETDLIAMFFLYSCPIGGFSGESCWSRNCPACDC